MILGIALHSSLSFIGVPRSNWIVQDVHQHAAFGWFVSAVHGFRMPLFFFLSGFFTAMLWRGRGLRAMVRHRYHRVFLPLMLCIFTILPTMWVVTVLASHASSGTATTPESRTGATVDRLHASLTAGMLPIQHRGFADVPAAEAARQQGERQLGSSIERLKDALTYPVFRHLWFLWFLCWLCVGFTACAFIADRLRWSGPPSWMVISPVLYLWLIPLTMLPELLMAPSRFGPDKSAGLVPNPVVLSFYAIFFGFGALYFDSHDHAGRIGRRWWITLPVCLLVIFPLAYELTKGDFGFRSTLPYPEFHATIAVMLQATYAWLMTFSLMGLFRQLFSGRSRTMRYLSDSSYWLYVSHLPLVVLFQFSLRGLALPALVKDGVIVAGTMCILLIAYEKWVRYTWLGRLLNGPRTRPANQQSLRDEEEIRSGQMAQSSADRDSGSAFPVR